jgi:hypothetical protein
MSSLDDFRKNAADLGRQPVRQVFINCTLNPTCNFIDMLMRRGYLRESIQPMLQLISELDPDDLNMTRIKEADEQLKRIYRHGMMGTHTGYLELLEIWRKITGHIHVYYYREFGLRAKNVNPLPIRNEEQAESQPENTRPQHIGESP